MRVFRARDLRSAAERVLPFAMRDEARNCVQVEILNRLFEAHASCRDTYLAWVEDQGEVCGVAVRFRASLLLSPCIPSEALDALAADACAAMPELKAWTAPTETASQFAVAWQRVTGRDAYVQMRLRAFRLDRRVVQPPATQGVMRPYTEQERDLLVGWHRAATEEMGFLDGPTQPVEAVEILLAECLPFLWWDDGRPVSMAATGSPTPNGGRIHSVYTPPEMRGRGYGINCVAALSQHLLDHGSKFCFLFTLPAMSTIYQRIGYYSQGDVDSWVTS